MEKVIKFTASALNPNDFIEDQINQYMTENPTHSVVAMSYVIVGALEKALVVVDIPDEKPVTEEVKDHEDDGKPHYESQRFNNYLSGRNGNGKTAPKDKDKDKTVKQ